MRRSEYGRPIWLISDEPYSRLVFSDAEFHSPSEFYPYTLISYSYGKVLLTPGERIGWLAFPRRSRTESFCGRPSRCRKSPPAGCSRTPCCSTRSATSKRCPSIWSTSNASATSRGAALRAAGYDFRTPEGTFYLWVRSPDPDDIAFCRLLAESKVLVLPGSVCEVPGYFRISLTASRKMVDDAIAVFRDIAGRYEGMEEIGT